MKRHHQLVATCIALCAAGSLFAQVNPQIERHHRSLNVFHSDSAPAPTPVAAAAPTRPVAAPVPASSPAPARPVATNTLIDNTGTPPSANPGECYTRVLVSPTMTSVTERVLAREESFELIEVPAVLETVEERVMVRAASERQEVIPATYKEVEERILVTPAQTRQIPVAATFETRTDRMLVKPERSFWKKGTGPLQKFDGETGEIMCYVTEPAVYETVSRQVVTSPASVRTQENPAVFDTVKRTVIDQPARIQKIEIPAEFSMVKVQRVKTPARTEKRVIPAEFATVSRQVQQGQSRLEWRRVLCETNVSPEVIADIQTALNARNFSAGSVDGVYGKSTEQAIARFQSANNLPQGGLTYETLAALGVTK
ncbi:MAG: peptidoglycan-binding protein [Verrucomicrobia bacterium]|nr:MAG: peptidoglycan-binding protein [Verrucomicrobiota bacterium]